MACLAIRMDYTAILLRRLSVLPVITLARSPEPHALRLARYACLQGGNADVSNATIGRSARQCHHVEPSLAAMHPFGQESLGVEEANQ